MQNENADLKKELMTNLKNGLSDTDKGQMISDRIAFIEQALADKDEQIKELRAKITGYMKTNRALNKENNAMASQNKQFQSALFIPFHFEFEFE